MKAIEIQELTKVYGTFTAVDHISFSAEKGQLIGFLGVNGAGKSTTINMMSTLLAPTSGSIRICGHDVKTESRIVREKIGIVYQNNVLADLLTVRENLTCHGIIHGTSPKQAAERLQTLSSLFSLEELLKKRYSALSGGQKRRCEIAAALMHTPELLILDEPTTGLDPAARQEVWRMISRLQEQTEMTVFLTTHYMEEAAQADKIIILSKGKIMTEGQPHELKERYASDKLKLYCSASQRVMLLPQIIHQNYTQENYGFCIRMQSAKDALSLLHQLDGSYDSFEVVQGTLDDVFLDVTKEVV
ncbi:MAG: ABC transporter ATP-binding protein [Oscillospiraceae bacterium]|nr:ABC transporter ATP-binding protein [Oscillospiraceae bacterium]